MRYVIKHPNGIQYFTEVELTGEQIAVKEGTSAALRPTFRPLFDAVNTRQALKYDTEQDAKDALAHPHLSEPFPVGCLLLPVES